MIKFAGIKKRMPAIIVLPAALAFFSTSANAAGKILTILHTNDLHSRITEDFRPAASGGRTGKNVVWARLATAIKKEKSGRKNPVIVLDAGDFLGSPAQIRSRNEKKAALYLLKRMGYDAVTPGNHDLEVLPKGLSGIIAYSLKKGGMPEIVFSSGATGRRSADNVFQGLFDSGHFKKNLILQRQGIRIGIFSVIGRDARKKLPRSLLADIRGPVEVASEAVQILRKKEKADIVICLSHSGVRDNDDFDGEDEILAENVRGIDIIVGGHSHTRMNVPLIIQGVIIVQSGELGKNLGVLDVEYNKVVKVKKFKNVDIDSRVAEDKEIKAIIESL